MIDDMQYHIIGWHRILTRMGKNISLQETKEECYGKNHEFLERLFPKQFSEEEKDSMSLEKEKVYQQEFRQHLKLIDGLEDFLHVAREQGIRTAMGTAAIRFNVDFVLDGLSLHHLFDAVICAGDVKNSKPHPETFLACAENLNVHPKDCLVFEDMPKGVEAAQNAGMDCIVITTLHQPKEFSCFENIICYIDNYFDDKLYELLCLKEKA